MTTAPAVNLMFPPSSGSNYTLNRWQNLMMDPLTPTGIQLKPIMDTLEKYIREYSGYTGPHPQPAPEYTFDTTTTYTPNNANYQYTTDTNINSTANPVNFIINNVSSTTGPFLGGSTGTNYIDTTTTTPQYNTWNPPSSEQMKFYDLWNRIAPLIEESYRQGFEAGFKEGVEHGQHMVERGLDYIRDIDLDKKVERINELSEIKGEFRVR